MTQSPSPTLDKPITQSRTYLGAFLVLLWGLATVYLKLRGLPGLPGEILAIPAALMGVGIRDAISRNTVETREAKAAAETAVAVAVTAAPAGDPRGATIEALSGPPAEPVTNPAYLLRD